MGRAEKEVRRRLEERERSLSPYAVRSASSRGRERPEPPPSLGTEFQRDRERILGTHAFRRLKHKTQVFLAPLGDHYMTRLTHTLEVACLARAIARALSLNEDLAEAIALGHDLGHTPFGHIGEETLDHLSPWGFRHAPHSLRVVDLLENGGQGLNLTWEVRQGIAAHSKPRGDFLRSHGFEGLTLEAQVCRLADALAYLIHDTRDALRAGLLRPRDLPSPVVHLLGPVPERWRERFLEDCVEHSWPASGAGEEGKRPAITLSPRLGRAVVALREFLFEKVYIPIARGPESEKAREVITLLYRHFCAHPEDLPPEFRRPGERVERGVVDYIAGMTDGYALMVAERLRPGISEGVRFLRL